MSHEAEWRRRLEINLDWAAGRMAKPDSQVVPLFQLYTRDGEGTLFAMPISTDEEEHDVYVFLAAAALALDTWGATHVAEAWVRTVEQRPDETEAEVYRRLYEIAPEKTENRREVVVATAVWRDVSYRQSMIAATRAIERTADGTPSLGPIEWSEETDGPLQRILPQRRPPAHIVAEARRFYAAVIRDLQDIARRH